MRDPHRLLPGTDRRPQSRTVLSAYSRSPSACNPWRLAAADAGLGLSTGCCPGNALVGTWGKLNATHYGDTWEVYPAELGEAELLNEVRGDGHERQWLGAIRGRGETVSNFAISEPLTEFLMLSNVASLIGQPFTYGPVTGDVLDNDDAQAGLHQEYRQGWTL
jgi:hypothetical protein